MGEAIVAAARLAVLQQAPLIVFTASGGARMQEGAISLMQMPRTVIATRLVKDAGLPFIVVLTDPTTGGVSASFAMLGDIQIAEPGALIGFAGARVIEQTVRETLPEGFQRAEYLLKHGIIDMVVKRSDMKDTLAPHHPCCGSRNAGGGVSRIDADRRAAARAASRLIDLSLDRLERLLAKLGHPERRLPPVDSRRRHQRQRQHLRVSARDGRGRGMRVHVYTSPHLVRFNERIRIAGELVSDADLVAAMEEIERVNDGAPITVFEVITAAAFHLFAAVAGRFMRAGGWARRPRRRDECDSAPAACAITSISMDHRELLGPTLDVIAREKAGIMKPGVPVAIGAEPREVHRGAGRGGGTDRRAIVQRGRDWSIAPTGAGLRLHGPSRDNRSAAPIAAGPASGRQCRHRDRRVAGRRPRRSDDAIARGIATAEWPARLQRLTGHLASCCRRTGNCGWTAGHDPGAGVAFAEHLATGATGRFISWSA